MSAHAVSASLLDPQAIHLIFTHEYAVLSVVSSPVSAVYSEVHEVVGAWEVLQHKLLDLLSVKQLHVSNVLSLSLVPIFPAAQLSTTHPRYEPVESSFVFSVGRHEQARLAILCKLHVSADEAVCVKAEVQVALSHWLQELQELLQYPVWPEAAYPEPVADRQQVKVIVELDLVAIFFIVPELVFVWDRDIEVSTLWYVLHCLLYAVLQLELVFWASRYEYVNFVLHRIPLLLCFQFHLCHAL